MKLLLSLLLAGASAQQYACMFGNPRCGLCMDDPDCGGQQMPTACEFSTWFQEAFDAGDYPSCDAYVSGGSKMSDDVTKDDLCDEDGGVPALAKGITYRLRNSLCNSSALDPDPRSSLAGTPSSPTRPAS